MTDKAVDGGPPLPDWAAGDTASAMQDAPFVLEVIKDGVPADELPLGDARCLVGRAADAVQVPLAHPSISRVHACFQRSTDGLLYVADCASSHGSRLNKVPLPPLKYVETRDGDVLQFGASTRIFALHRRGRERAERALLDGEVSSDADTSATKHDATRKVRKVHTEQAKPKLEQSEKKRVTAADLHATTWGQDEDAPELAEADGAALPEYLTQDKGFMEYGGEISSTLKTEEISERDEKLRERLETKLRKLNANRSHNQRLLTKEGGLQGLSDGQRRAFDQNDTQISKLTDEISELEKTIRGRNDQRIESRRRNDDNNEDGYLYAKQRDEDVEEEDMRDLTTPLARAKTAEEKLARRNRRFAAAPAAAPPPPEVVEADGMTYEALLEQRKRVDAALERLRDPRAVHPVDRGDDVLDDFMASNAAAKASDVEAAAARDAAALEKERARLTVLLDFARPAVAGLSSRATPAALSPDPVVLPVAAPPRPLSPDGFQSTVSTARRAAATELEPKTAADDEAPPPAVLPPPKPPAPPELRVPTPMAPTIPRAPEPAPDEEQSKRRKKKKRRVAGPARGPAASALEGGDEAWVPLVGQDGSGRTALNDKLGY